uniref:Uncharacterized protein n=1 Tax=Myotis myotis TaxID=51298 RepID=A0A7J7Z529_MYOMY|nr:hypothetical protein mMyoMyo1_010547 [Myotis myotis]
MSLLVLPEMVRSHEFLAALITSMWPVSGVYPHMLSKLIRMEERPRKTFPLTFIGPLNCVFALVTQEVGALGVSFSKVLILAAVRPCNWRSAPVSLSGTLQFCSALCGEDMGCSDRNGSSWEAGWLTRVQGF